MRLARRWLLPGLLAGALIRVLLLPLPGTPAVGIWKLWAVAGSSDPAALYGIGGSPPERRVLSWNGVSGTAEYPPAALYEVGLMGAIYAQISPLFIDSETFTWLVKTPGLLAEGAFLITIWAWRRRLHGSAAGMALAFWLNPAVILTGSALGYLDAQAAVPATLSLIAATIGMATTAGGLLVLAVLTRIETAFIAPVVALALIHTAGRAWKMTLVDTAAGATAAFTLLAGPVILRGAWPNMLQALTPFHAADTRGGAAIVIAASLAALWRSRHVTRLSAWALLAAWMVYVSALFNAEVHENQAYLAVPLLVIGAGLDRALRPLCWGMSLMTAMNVFAFYGFDGRTPFIGRTWTFADLAAWLWFINLAMLVWFTKILWTQATGFSVRAAARAARATAHSRP